MELATLWERTRAIILDLNHHLHAADHHQFDFWERADTNAVVDASTSGGFSSFSSTTAVDGIWLWLAAMVYFSLQEGLFGATLGKAVVGIRVTDLTGRRVGWGAILLRNRFRVIDSFPGIYPVTFTLDWHGFLPGWELSAMQSNC